MQMLEAGGGRTRALLRLNRQHILPSCAELKDSQPTLPSWEEPLSTPVSFANIQAELKRKPLILWATQKRESISSTCRIK